MAGAITPKLVSQGAVQIPDSGYVTIFVDSADGIPKYKDSSGVVHTFSAVTVSDGVHTDIDDTLVFNSSNFYITQDSSGNPVVNLGTAGITDHGDLSGLGDDDHTQYIRVDGTRAFTGVQSHGGNRITNVGVPVAATDAARLQDVGPGFYGITVGETDNSPSFRGITSVKFNNDLFYVTQNAPNTDEVQINFRGVVTDHGNLIGLGDDDHTQYILVDGTRSFTGVQSHGGNRITNLGAPVAASDAARLQDVGPGFYGIVVKDDDTVVKTDSIRFHGRNFDVDATGDGATVTLTPEIKAAGFYLNPGFNGIGRSLNKDIISFDVPTAFIDTYFFESFVDQGFIIDDLQVITSSGSAIVGFYILEDGEEGFGVGISGLGSVSVSSNKKIVSPTGNNIVNPGDSVLMSLFYLQFQNNFVRHLRGRLKVTLAG